MTLTARERFLVRIFTLRPSRADAIIVLCGEDAMPRLEMAADLFRIGLAPVVCFSGGKDDGKRWIGAERARDMWTKAGIAPNRLFVEKESQNTLEQASQVANLACERDWTRLLLVASAYHAPRSFLTFRREFSVDVRITPVAVVSPWNECPEWMTDTRSELLDVDIAKCATYANDVASWEDGLKALEGL